MPKSETSLNDLLYEIRRISEHREILTDKKINAMYQSLTKDLNAYLAEGYIKYADSDGRFYVSYLDAQNKRAKFLQEIVQNVDFFTPKLRKEIMSLVNDTFTESYKGMVAAVKKANTAAELARITKDINVRPEVLKQAVNNNISKLTLPAVLEKHRGELIYQIQQELNIGLMNGDRYETMAKRISERVGVSQSKARNIVRTETHRNIESGFMDCAEHLGEGLSDSGYIYAVTWRTMDDERVRPQVRRKTAKGWKTTLSKNGANHVKMEGATVKVGEMFDLGGGVKAKAPSQSGIAAHDCNCRCFLEYNLMTVEEFAKATKQTPEEVRKKYSMSVKEKDLTSNGKNSKMDAENYELLIDNVPDSLEEQEKLWGAFKSTNITPEESKYIKQNYTSTTNSWTINNKLREFPDMSIEEIYKGNSKNGKTARALQSVIQKNTIPQNTILTRNAGNTFAQEALGLTPRQLNLICEYFDETDVQDELKQYIGTKITESAFVSTSANPKMNVFSEKPVRLELKVKKGHKAYITENTAESEVILDRGTQYVIEGFDKDTNSYGMPILKIIAKVLD